MYKSVRESIKNLVSVSLRSYIHSYRIDMPKDLIRGLGFPSPYGVIFILTTNTMIAYKRKGVEFPSPYGVIFILTWCFSKFNKVELSL